jgi:ABC-type branched-subunit amino acid transport system permease subunit
MLRTEDNPATSAQDAKAAGASADGRTGPRTTSAVGRTADGARRLYSEIKTRRLGLPACVVLAAIVGFFALPDDLLFAGTNSLAAAVIGVGLFLPIATLREMPLCAAGVMGLGAMNFGHIASQFPGGAAWGIFLGILAGLATSIGLFVFTGLASLVVTGLYFVVASLVVQAAIEKVAFAIPGITSGGVGWTVPQADLSGWFDTQRFYYLTTAIVAGAFGLFAWWVLRSRLGRHAVLVGSVPEGASAVGLRNWMVKLLIFGISGLMIGVGGLLLATSNGTPPTTQKLGIVWSVIYLAIPVAGGLRSLSSVWLVAAAFTALPIYLERLLVPPNALSGGILLAAAVIGQNRDRLGRWVTRLRSIGRTRPELATGDA